jgi:hypothetical protein
MCGHARRMLAEVVVITVAVVEVLADEEKGVHGE